MGQICLDAVNCGTGGVRTHTSAVMSHNDPNLAKLEALADAAGADHELVQEAQDMALEEELEQEWAKFASLL